MPSLLEALPHKIQISNINTAMMNATNLSRDRDLQAGSFMSDHRFSSELARLHSLLVRNRVSLEDETGS